MILKKTFSIVLIVCMIASFISTVVYANEGDTSYSDKPEKNIWNGTIASSYDGGTGTEEDPYQIKDAQQLAYMREQIASNKDRKAHFILCEDIYLNDTNGYKNWEKEAPKNVWIPIGVGNELNESNHSAFHGTFDGDGHTIHGLYTDPSSSHNGLFGVVVSATIENLNISDSYVIGNESVGAIAAAIAWGTTIKNCSNTSYVTGKSKVGGIIGFNYTGTTCEYCYNAGNITGNTSVGGIVGRDDSAYSGVEISYCCNTGMVIGCFNVGGIIGNIENTGTGDNGVHNSYNAGEISCTGNNVGGIVGNLSHWRTVEKCYNVGSIKVGNGVTNSGGIVGGRGLFTTFKSNYYLDSCGAGGGGTAKTKEELTYINTYEDFDFKNIWYFDEESKYMYPMLYGMPEKIRNDNADIIVCEWPNFIEQYTWGFDNYIVEISEETIDAVYGNTWFANELKMRQEGKRGVCYGFALSSALIFKTLPNVKLWEPTGNLSNVQNTNNAICRVFPNSDILWTPKQYIEYLHLMQYSQIVKLSNYKEIKNKQFTDLYEQCKKSILKKEPIVIAMQSNDGAHAHALVPYKISLSSDNLSAKLYVYDCNDPIYKENAKSRYILLKRENENEKFNYWEYDFAEHAKWNSDRFKIAYYSNLDKIYDSLRLKLTLTFPWEGVKDVLKIIKVNGNCNIIATNGGVLKIANGRIISNDIEGISPLVAYSNEDEELTQNEIYLSIDNGKYIIQPIGDCTINTLLSENNFEWQCGDNMEAEIKISDSDFMIKSSSELETKLNLKIMTITADNSVESTSISGLTKNGSVTNDDKGITVSGFSNIRVQYNKKNENLISMKDDLNPFAIYFIEKNRIKLVPTITFPDIGISNSVNEFTLEIITSEHGTISPNINQTVSYGSSQTLTITPDSGYEIADVLVDGKSVGSVSSYTFENVTSDHTISATFKKKEEDKNPEADALAKRIKAAKAVKIKASSSQGVDKKGKRYIKIKWTKKGAAVTGYQVYRSFKKKSGFKKFYTTKEKYYYNTKALKKGKRHYYKVRAYTVIDGKKYYSRWSNLAYRTVKK